MIAFMYSNLRGGGSEGEREERESNGGRSEEKKGVREGGGERDKSITACTPSFFLVYTYLSKRCIIL